MACCQPALSGDCPAPTAEALMRSRYCAYALKDGRYLVDTHHPDTRDPALASRLESTFESCQWTGLTVTARDAGGEHDETGTVTFEAGFLEGGRAHILREHSRFVRLDGRWVYVDGEGSLRESPRASPGRNDPCPCGSGQKFKKCHGR